MLQLTSIIFVAVLGFAVSAYVYYKKTRREKLVCMIGDHDCNKVVTSKQSKLIGISLDVWGLAYYGAIVLYYTGNFFIPFSSIISYSDEIMKGVSFVAFLMTFYFVYVWVVLVKEFCEWCVASALFTIILFFLIMLI